MNPIQNPSTLRISTVLLWCAAFFSAAEVVVDLPRRRGKKC